MPACHHCGAEISGESLFTCSYCGRKACTKHRLPEKHDCIALSVTRTLAPELRPDVSFTLDGESADEHPDPDPAGEIDDPPDVEPEESDPEPEPPAESDPEPDDEPDEPPEPEPDRSTAPTRADAPDGTDGGSNNVWRVRSTRQASGANRRSKPAHTARNPAPTESRGRAGKPHREWEPDSKPPDVEVVRQGDRGRSAESLGSSDRHLWYFFAVMAVIAIVGYWYLFRFVL